MILVLRNRRIAHEFKVSLGYAVVRLYLQTSKFGI